MGTQLVPVELRPVNVPFFPGFYESALSYHLDREEEQAVEWLCEEGARFAGKDAGDVADALYWSADYSQAWLDIAQEYAETLAWKAGFHARFDGMDSPREYNFTTDRLYLAVTPATLQAWMREVDLAVLTRVAEQRHKSRSGFISFYSADWTEWGPVTEWDHNQAGTLMAAVLETRGDLDSIEDDIESSLVDSGAFGQAMDAALDLDAAAARLATT